MLLLRPLEEETWEVMIKGKITPPAELLLEEGAVAHIIRTIDGGHKEIRFALPEGTPDLDTFLERWGEVPLPPYIVKKRAGRSDPADRERYQTVYAAQPGAVAAPTAGLHFDDSVLKQVSERGATIAKVTLHVGAGTFQPVREEMIEKHRMHHERYAVPPETMAAVERKRVLAVGTTSLRALEAAASGNLEGETDLFIYPGYKFRVVQRLLTNFHLPKSTLLMLVAAFAGLERIREAYAHAIEQRYRFFSYGDAMLIDRSP